MSRITVNNLSSQLEAFMATQESINSVTLNSFKAVNEQIVDLNNTIGMMGAEIDTLKGEISALRKEMTTPKTTTVKSKSTKASTTKKSTTSKKATTPTTQLKASEPTTKKPTLTVTREGHNKVYTISVAPLFGLPVGQYRVKANTYDAVRYQEILKDLNAPKGIVLQKGNKFYFTTDNALAHAVDGYRLAVYAKAGWLQYRPC